MRHLYEQNRLYLEYVTTRTTTPTTFKLIERDARVENVNATVINLIGASTYHTAFKKCYF